MPQAYYLVANHKGRWTIKAGKRRFGPYRNQEHATNVAIDTAYRAGLKGFEAKVLVQRTDEEFRTEWTFGADTYPPAKSSGARPN